MRVEKDTMWFYNENYCMSYMSANMDNIWTKASSRNDGLVARLSILTNM